MKPFYPIIVAASLWFVGCDVRKKDKVAPMASDNKEVVHNEKPTNVQIIDSVHNFGSVQEGTLVEYDFRFKNTGTEPLVIYAAQASCGCTVPEKPEHPIKPGEIGVIKAKFNTENRPGEAHKSITVSSNAQPAFPLLVLEGDVIGSKE